MISTFFSFALVAVGSGQLLESPPVILADRARSEARIRDLEAKAQRFRAACANLARDVSVRADGRVDIRQAPNARLLAMEGIVSELELDAAGKRSTFEQIQNFSPTETPLLPEVQQSLNGDAALSGFRRELQVMDESMLSTRTFCGPDHPLVKQQQSQRATLQQRLDEATAIKTVKFHAQFLQKAQARVLSAETMLAHGRTQLKRAKAEQRQQDRILGEYVRLLEECEQLRRRLTAQDGVEGSVMPGTSPNDLLEAGQQAETRPARESGK